MKECERVREVRSFLIITIKNIVITNAEFNEQFRKRTKDFAVRVLKFLSTVPFNIATKIMSYQLGKSGTSVGVNFCAFFAGEGQKQKNILKYVL